MNSAEIAAQIAALEQAIADRVSGNAMRRIKEGDREMEMEPVSLAEMRQRLAELQSLAAGRSERPRSRLVYF